RRRDPALRAPARRGGPGRSRGVALLRARPPAPGDPGLVARPLRLHVGRARRRGVALHAPRLPVLSAGGVARADPPGRPGAPAAAAGATPLGGPPDGGPGRSWGLRRGRGRLGRGRRPPLPAVPRGRPDGRARPARG